MNTYLRPEARPADWKSLDKVQRDAFSRAASIICEAIEGLPTEPPSNYYRPKQSISLTDSGRASRTLFISGARGTGKTTVLVTLIRASLKGSIEGLHEENETNMREKNVIECVKKMNEHAIWLEPLDMEPLPKNSNLLGSIIARVEAAIRDDSLMSIGSSLARDADYRPRQLFEPSTDYHDAMLKLQRLQTDIAIAWDGNIQSREGHLDPDAFALEMMRSEQSRLNINSKFHQVLDLLSYKALQKKGKKGAIFILPVDDLDLNPSSCLKLLNLFRLISVPRLFTIVLGDLDLAEVVLNLKFSSDLAKVAEGAESLYQVAISKAAANISSNSLRKLVPSNQRLNLAPMNTLESLLFRPLGSAISEYTMYALLDKFPLTLNRPFIEKKIDQVGNENQNQDREDKKNQGHMKINRLADFLLFKGFSVLQESAEEPDTKNDESDSNGEKPDTESDETDKKMNLDKIIKNKVDMAGYHGLNFLNSTPREITDIWFGTKKALDTIDLQKKDSEAKATLETDYQKHFYSLLANQIRNKLFEELSYEDRSTIRQSIRQTPKGEWELGKLPLKMSVESELVEKIEQKTIKVPFGNDINKINEYIAKIRISLPKGWRFEREQSIDRTQAKEGPVTNVETEVRMKIPIGTASTIMLFNDLLTMCKGNEGFRSTLFKPSEMKLNWIGTEWHLGEYLSAELAWPCPPCKSFWEYDVFIHSWAKVAQEIIQSPSTSTDFPSFKIESLFFVWISAGTCIVDRKSPVTIQTLQNPDWSILISRLEGLINEYKYSPYRQEILDWIINIALLIMPEIGLPLDCQNPFQNSPVFNNFWNSQTLLIAQRRAQKLALLLKEGMVDLVQELKNEIPSWFNTSIIPEDNMIYRYAGVELGEEEKEKKRSHELAAIVDQKLSKRFYKLDELGSKISNIGSDITKMKREIDALKKPKKETAEAKSKAKRTSTKAKPRTAKVESQVSRAAKSKAKKK